MTEYDNTNSGVLFKNGRKTEPKQPDYNGKGDLNGEGFWISAWIKQGKKGKFLSLSFNPMDEAAQAPPKQEGEIPF